MMKLPQADRPLNERFADPPAPSRILKIVHGLPDSPDDQDVLLRSLASQGFGGMATNVSFDKYLQSEEHWAAFVRGVNAARDMGMALWLYDERGYPSGAAGGLTLQGHPECQARGLLIAETATPGGPVSLDVPPGEPRWALAFPEVDGVIDLDTPTDLAGHVKEGKLTWDAPPGSWRVMAITESLLHEGTHAAVSLADKLPYINLLMPEATARFIEVTHDTYAEHLGNDLGQWFIATFTDEPSLMSLFMRPQPYRVLPWAPSLPGAFEARHGYALEPLIPALVADAGPRGQAVRYDFWDTVAELVSESYFGQLQTWCRAHSFRSGGHLLMEESLLTHVPLYGDLFRCARRVDAPSIDCLTSLPANVPWAIARLFSSVAELEGRSVTMCETSDHVQRYRPAGDDRPVREVTEGEIRGTCNHLILNGITTITSYYSFGGLSSEQLVRLNEWTGRCSTMLEGGHQVNDVALLYPIESAWVRFEPSRRWVDDAPAEAKRIEEVYRAAANSLYAARRDVTFVDARAFAEAKADTGVLRHGGLAWRVVVLPCADTMPLAAWENLAEFYRTGGAVIALTTLPANSESEFPSPQVQELAGQMFGAAETVEFTTNAAGGVGAFLPAGSEGLLPYVIDAFLKPEVQIEDRDAPIRVTHRRIDNHEVYFLINDSDAPWSGSVSLAAAGPGEQWDPGAGFMTPLAGPEAIDVNLKPYGGVFYRFAAASPERRRTGEGAGLPEFVTTPLPQPKGDPSVGKGEFVDGGIVPPRDSRDVWQARATLTKGQTDTFLFLGITFPQPVDLSGAVYLRIESWTPEGQTASTPLRVFLRDTAGREYIANTSRPLDEPGRAESLVFFSQFEAVGWREVPPGPLDRTAITGMSIGWGGYLGAEGETVEFAVTQPELGRLSR